MGKIGNIRKLKEHSELMNQLIKNIKQSADTGGVEMCHNCEHYSLNENDNCTFCIFNGLLTNNFMED